jgi:NADH-quinone oxidoreductase subunit N
MAGLIMLLAAVTCTFGNLAAYGQTNIKRLLAYSTIAHAGYMMMPIAAAVVLMGRSKEVAAAALGSMALYIAVYLFMNLGAFAVAAFLRNKLGSENIADYAGLVRRSPGVAVCFAIILFSLVGLPPLAGFSAKFAIFSYVFHADLLGLLFIGVLNTVLSLFYYVRIVKIMMLDEERPGRPAAAIPLVSGPGVYCAAVTLPLVVLFVWWGGLFELARTAAGMLF